MRIFITIIAFTVLTGVILNFTIENPKFNNPIDEIEHAQKTDNLDRAEKVFLDVLKEKKLDPDLNYGYITNHFAIPETTKIGKNSYKYRDDTKIYSYYKLLTTSLDSIEKDLGYYFLGLCYLCEKDYSIAFNNFMLVKNPNIKYLNNSIGNIYKRSLSNKAIDYYEKEIKINGNIAGAVHNLSEILLAKKKLQKFESLMQDEITQRYVDLSKKREFYYLKGDFTHYIKTLWVKFINSIDRYGFLGALIIALIWLFYLRYIDVFEKEKWYYISILFISSSAFTYFSFFLYDIFNISLGFDLNGSLLNDLMYCIFGIGIIEETVKLIPFVLFLLLSRAVNEPIDYIIYACISAIGFSFTENILYFQNDSYQIMHGRALASVVAHMCNSSIVAYGFILSKYKSKLPVLFTVLISLILASIVHGLYDFWIINKVVKNYFSILTLLVLISSVFIWNSIKNNALNNSPFFDHTKKLESEIISKYLFTALSLVFLFEYLVISVNYGPSAGNRLFFQSILSGTFLMIFLTGKLAQFKLKFGAWEKIKFWDSTNKRK